MSDKIVLADKDPRSNKISIEVKNPERPVVQAVASAEVKKPTLWGRTKSVLFSSDSTSVTVYVVQDILIPALKNTLWEVVTGSMKMSMFGQREPTRGIQRDRERSYYNYGTQPLYGREHDHRPYSAPAERRTTTSLSFDDIIIPSRVDAEKVLAVMGDMLDRYGYVTVSDFHDLVGVSTISTDSGWGWDNISQAFVTPTRGGYSIKLPRAIPIK